MNNWKVKLTAGGKTLAEVKFQRNIVQLDSVLPLLFIIVMIPLNYILRKCTGNSKFTKSDAKINYLMYVDNIKPFFKKKINKRKRIGDSNTNNEKIQQGYRDGIWHRRMCHTQNERRKKTEWIELPNQKRIRRLGEKEITSIWKNWKWTPSNKQRWNEKFKKWVLRMNEKTFRNQILQQKNHQRNKYLGSAPSKIPKTILTMDKKKIKTNVPEDKKVDNDAQLLAFERCHTQKICHEKEVEENSPALKIAQMYLYDDKRTTLGVKETARHHKDRQNEIKN